MRRVASEPGSPAEPFEEYGEAAADGQRRQRGWDSPGSGDDEAGEGGGADAVGEEGEPPQDYLRSEQPGQGREQGDLDRRALHERELERIKHENHYRQGHGDEGEGPDPSRRRLDRPRG